MNAKIRKAIDRLEQSGYLWFECGVSGDAAAYLSAGLWPEGVPQAHYLTTIRRRGSKRSRGLSTFSSIEALAEAGLKLQPDLRRWRRFGQV